MLVFYIILFFYFAGLGANLSSLSPYLISNFEKKSEWVFIAIQVMVPVGTLFAGWLSDSTKKIRIYLYYSILFTIPAQYLLFSFPDDWFLTMILGGLLRFLLSANYQWIAIAALEKLGEHKFSKVRSSGTLGFLLIQFLLYVLTLPLVNVIQLPETTGKLGSLFYLIPIFFLRNIPEFRNSTQEFRFKDALLLLHNKSILLFFILSFFFYGAYQITDNYQGRFFQISYGLESVYLSWVFAVLLEIPFLLLIPNIVHKYNYYLLFYIAIISGIIRFTFLAISVRGFSLPILLLLQMPHAILFAGYYMGGIHFLRKSTPPHIYGSMYGLFSIFSMSLGGMAGNIISSELLHSNMGYQIISSFDSSIPYTKSMDFLPVFIFSVVIYSLILPFYLLLEKKLT